MKRAIFAALVLWPLSAVAGEATPPQAPQQLTIRLSVQDWNVVMQGLGELQLKTAQPVVAQIQEQARQQLQPPTLPEKPKK